MANNNFQNNSTKMNPKVRITFTPKEGNIKAYCSATLYGGIGIKGIRVVEGKNGNFVSMPGQKNSKGEYVDTVFPITKEAHAELYKAVMQAYEQHMAQSQTNQPEMTM